MLQDLRVIDLSRVLAGPYAGQILGDLGADVIKIERPEHGDDTRHWGPPFLPHAPDTAAYYATANRNKRSRVLNFSDERDRQILLGLVDHADVLVENFRDGSLARYELDAATLCARNPRLVYCSITGFGSDGPYKERAGYDALIQAMGGLMSITGPAPELPTKVGVAVTDLSAGLFAAIAILAALQERARSGAGQHVEVSLLDTQVAMLANVAMAYLVSGEVPQPLGNKHATVVPYETFATADQPLVVAVGNDGQFKDLCGVLGARWYQDARFATNAARVCNRALLCADIADRLMGRTRDEWLDAFSAVGVPCGPVNDLADVAADPQVRHRDLFTVMDDGQTPCLRSPMRFSRTPIQRYASPPGLGEHADADFERSPTRAPPIQPDSKPAD